MDELYSEIEASPPGLEREELERTLQVCQAIVYGIEEGFFRVEEDEDEEMYLYPEAQCFHAPVIEA